MGDTLSQVLSSYRVTQKGDHVGLLSKLKIGNDLYDIKDPAVEELASAVETRLSTLEGKSWTAVSKGGNDAKFATAVTQGTDGAITVTYGTIRDAELADTTSSGQVVTGIAQTVDGVVSATMGTVDAANVTFSETNWTATNAKAAILEALTKAIGTSGDASSADTINGAKAYADAAVAALAGQDWTQASKTVQAIIAEIENSENANAWVTAIDKLAGLGEKTPAVYYTQEEINAAHEGDDAYGKTTSDVKTPAVGNTVKDYVDTAVANASGNASSAIAALDATVRGNLDANDAVTSGHKVGVKVTEVDGVITDVTVVEDDIASASDLTTLTNTVEEHSEVTSAALNDLNSRLGTVETNIGSIDLSTSLGNKANKAAITTASVNNWTAQYVNTNNEETLQWTNTVTSVYVPTGQSL